MTDRQPKIVVLCGSTRFYAEFQRANYQETMTGKIVLSVGFYPHATAEHGHGEGVEYDSTQKVMLDELHKRKIDLADEVLILNPGGYLGESTLSEAIYAIDQGKELRWLVDPGMSRNLCIQCAGSASSYILRESLGRRLSKCRVCLAERDEIVEPAKAYYGKCAYCGYDGGPLAVVPTPPAWNPDVDRWVDKVLCNQCADLAREGDHPVMPEPVLRVFMDKGLDPSAAPLMIRMLNDAYQTGYAAALYRE